MGNENETLSIEVLKGFDGIKSDADGTDLIAGVFARTGVTRMKAYGRRLVACWNACKGISTESLERMGTIDRSRVELDVVRSQAIAQRDELLQALVDAVSTQPTDSPIKWVIRARAAIAKATGAQK